MKENEPEPEVVRVRQFGKRYGKCAAVTDLDLTVRRGEIYGLIGPDEAGKSSLLKAIAGVLSYETGCVEVFGVKVDSERSAERVKGRLGFLPQGLGLNLYPDLSVEENIDFFARLRLVPERALMERKERLLKMTRLDAFRRRPMKHLSGGMKQKLGLVCTLIHEPELVILDEPTTGVDPVSRRDFWAILTELLRQQGISALVSTAYLDEATRFHRISLLFGGHVVAEGTPDAIMAQVPATLFVVRAEPQPEALTRLKTHFPEVEARGSNLHVLVEGNNREEAQRALGVALAGLKVAEVRASDPELEDVFIALLRTKGLPGPSESAGPMLPRAPRQTSTAMINRFAIEADGLVRDFGNFRAVDHVSFRIQQGEIFGLLGANGAGNTTVIKMLTGIVRPNDGTGRIAGADLQEAGQAIKERIGYMSQAFSLYLDLTAVENIRLYAGIYGLDRKQTAERLEWILDLAKLRGHEHELAGSMPMGLRQRLALGCALVHQPQILFLDEPTSGVDPVGRRHFWEILFRLSREDGVAVLVTTHYMSEAEHCDHLALMFAGRIVDDASPSVMKERVEAEAVHLLELVVDDAAVALGILAHKGFPGATIYGDRIHLLSRQPQSDREKIAQIISWKGGLRAINPRPLSMEDVFVYRVTALEGQRSRPPGGGAP
jgi:ABC-type multidrug transport system ATPase subunit